MVKPNPSLTKTFIAAMALAAIAGTAFASLNSHTLHPSLTLALLALAAATSRMKAKLPGIDGSMSVNLPFLLLAVMNLSAVEAVFIACVSTMVQCWPKRNGKFRSDQLFFNVSMMAFATSVASLTWNAGWLGKTAWASEPLMLASTTMAFFVGQTAPVAVIIKLAEGAVMRRVWFGIVQMCFPYYVLSASVTSMADLVSRHSGWRPLIVLPIMYGVHRSFRFYFRQEAVHAAPMARVASAGS